MEQEPEPTFTGHEAADAQTMLRRELGLPPETFPAAAFIGMISDEIEQLRTDGRDDTAIAALLAEITGKAIPADTIARYYAMPGARGHPGSR